MRVGVELGHFGLLTAPIAAALETEARHARHVFEHFASTRGNRARQDGDQPVGWFAMDVPRTAGTAGVNLRYVSTTGLDLIPGHSTELPLSEFIRGVPAEADVPEEKLVVLLCDGHRSPFRLVPEEDFVSGKVILVQDARSPSGHRVYLKTYGPEDTSSYTYRADYSYLTTELTGARGGSRMLLPEFRVVQVVLEGESALLISVLLEIPSLATSPSLSGGQKGDLAWKKFPASKVSLSPLHAKLSTLN
jgi:hypothetical protein